MLKEKPLVSVLIANYNNGIYIKQAVDSVIDQTYENWEIIIVDDASTDNSWLIIQDIVKLHSNIYSYQNKKNLKVAATKSKATALANGEICAILDPDDALVNTAIAKHVQRYRKNPGISLVSSNYYRCDQFLNVTATNESIYRPENFYSYLSSTGGIHHFWTFQKTKYHLTKGFDVKLILAEDQDLFYKLEEVGEVQVIDEPLYYYRIHHKAISQGDKVALAYAYHLLAKINVNKRRSLHDDEKKVIKNSVLNFMDWGINKIEKSFRMKLMRKTIELFPELIFHKKIIHHIYRLVSI